MTVQQILEAGFVIASTDTPTLEETKRVLEFQICEIEKASWGATGLARLQKHRLLLAKVQELLNSRRGVDGMTPLSG
jgi:hypothetical protein